jgi:hypothetical protein
LGRTLGRMKQSKAIKFMNFSVHGVLATWLLFSVDMETAAQGTAFTYQGQLSDNGTVANGTYDLSFGLFTTATGGSPVISPLTNSAVAINNGEYAVILDFGAGIFTGSNYWLELSVRTNGAASFRTLSPRQAVLPGPYSIFAASARAWLILP